MAPQHQYIVNFMSFHCPMNTLLHMHAILFFYLLGVGE